MSPQMKKRIFEVEDKLIKKIDEEKEEKLVLYSWRAAQDKQYQQQKSHSVYYV